jgi:hypothetical protein
MTDVLLVAAGGAIGGLVGVPVGVRWAFRNLHVLMARLGPDELKMVARKTRDERNSHPPSGVA